MRVMTLWVTGSPGLRCFEEISYDNETKFWPVSADGVREENEG